MNTALQLTELTQAQRLFAEKEQAIPGVHCGRDAVCLYHEAPDVTTRWIVGSDGHILETIEFPR